MGFIIKIGVAITCSVRELHREFLRAGADVMQALTFYASDDKLENRGNSARIMYTVGYNSAFHPSGVGKWVVIYVYSYMNCGDEDLQTADQRCAWLFGCRGQSVGAGLDCGL